jgi:hypothetical protein
MGRLVVVWEDAGSSRVGLHGHNRHADDQSHISARLAMMGEGGL